MRQKIARACLGAAIGLAGPALFCRALSLGAGPTNAAAWVAWAAAALWTFIPQAGGRAGALTACAASWLASALLLPHAGIKPALALSVLSLACGLAIGPGPAPPRQTPGWAAALAAAAAVAWVRLLNLLGADALLSLTLVFSAAAAAKAAAAAAPRWLEDNAELWRAASGLVGLLGLGVLRFVGLNSGSPELLQNPLGGGGLFLLSSHAWAAVFLWSAAAGAASAPLNGATRFLSAAGPLAAAWLLPRLGSAPAAAFFHFLMILAAMAALGLRRLQPRSMLGQAALACLAAGLWLAWLSRSLLSDIWLNRLNAVFPGGRYLALRDDGSRSLGLYRFSSGAVVRLEEGGAWFNPEAIARRQAHLALLSHPRPRSMLLGVLSPASARSALTHGVEAAWVSNALARDVAAAAEESGLPWPPAGLRMIEGNLRQALKSGSAGYDVILLELPVLPSRPFFPAREDFSALRGKLSASGVLALRLPSPRMGQLPLLLAAAAASFPHAGAFELPGGPLLVFSLEPIKPDAQSWRARLPLAARLDDIDLVAQLPTLALLGPQRLPDPAPVAPTQEKP